MSYLEGVLSRSNGDVKRVEHEIDGVLTHELVHAFQYDARGSLPGGLVEGIADWVRGGAGLAPPHWREQPGECDRWDAGYERTGFFLSFLSRHFRDPLLVPKINLAARSDTWDDGALLRRVLGGEDVEELWALYKRTFGDKDQGTDDAPAPVPTHGARSGYGVGY
ncbi:hypothetical protein Rhopal_002500-T1 [Rhodotorula paludigena]|uniref:Plant basic secretory protein n=1 Tax=Rhodotorula paludigena TaxID=86838 RepID=A0AAV5GLG8_9BASI|nr:hypothetical protein Rhopal_002500-T1 [Rhodotorula paludigena]